ncbi:aminotransferase class I/II-fold pyridoxal phosphate-dependent enzyme [Streptantibioticus silvisoli]|uniref:Aminotransferase class I/II-fold pyridoxal phosphate-dependent enzyme n=1 Tax=Streptantibioticus silvisoli TaxID=2705255 RepID=A0ABT6VWC8_9ACTN|nr:aminotransferase class I/II-fold pyridoxal phosphate-dependent enzyme [Streptantibioticus silvisoli]MDI5962329.1 aminotransferase class I/II-fold pyridoxal phosphate-dependent enzyme [Streptantibioticus silvisoli]
MSRPWYQDFFTEPFWAVAEHEYTAERTDGEAGYLAAALPAGARVLDLGCGTGRHAIALARRGFDVTGADVGEWALRQAEARAEQAGAAVRWQRLDLLRDLPWPWPDGDYDAVVCVQSFGWGTDAQQLRLLREVRRVLAPGGLLVLDHSNLLALTAHYVPEATFETDGLHAAFHRTLKTVEGRSAGTIEVRRDGLPTAVVRDDIRLYQPAEIRELLTRAGFTVERVDAGFTTGAPVTMTSRYVQFHARRPPEPPAAISTWRPPARETGPRGLDLRWTPDEYDFVRPAVERAFAAVDPGTARAYHLADPFAGALASPVLSRHFAADLTPAMVTAGAGATGLLHALALLALPGPVLHLEGGHPDLPRWAAGLGARTVTTHPRTAVADLDRYAPTLLLLDHPTLGGEFHDRALIDELATAARARGAVVVIDEAYATYPGPAASHAPAVADHDNLVVVRSLSKGYCCGGLRVGFALAGERLTRRLRESAPPLGAGSASLAVAVRLLDEGDVFGPLRARIAATKPPVAAALRAAGVDAAAGAACLPWVTAPATPAALAALTGRGILAKTIGDRLKIAVPLSPDRVAAFHEVFTGDR